MMAVVLMVAHSSALFMPRRAPHPGRVQSIPRMQFSFGKLPGTPAVAKSMPVDVDETEVDPNEDSFSRKERR